MQNQNQWALFKDALTIDVTDRGFHITLDKGKIAGTSLSEALNRHPREWDEAIIKGEDALKVFLFDPTETVNSDEVRQHFTYAVLQHFADQYIQHLLPLD